MKNLAAEVGKIRDEIESVREELDWTRSGRLPKEEVAPKILEAVDGLAREFSAIVPHLAEPDGSPVRVLRQWLTPQTTLTRVNPETGIAHRPAGVQAAPTLCWLFGDLIKERCLRALDESSYVPGPPSAERPQLVAGLKKRLHALELEEERLIVAAEAEGLELYRRPDVDWSIVLNFDPDGVMGQTPEGLLPREEPVLTTTISSASPPPSQEPIFAPNF